jgi:hypothetical protein
MVFMNDDVLDAAINEVINNADRFDICSSEPATYTEATSTNTLGNETSLSFTGPADGDTSGRKGTLDAITDGDVTGTGTASHYGISDTSNSVLYIAQFAEQLAERDQRQHIHDLKRD